MVFAFYTQQNFQNDANFVDFKPRNHNSSQLFSEVLLEVFRKLGGIILKDKNQPNLKLKIVTKYKLNENYMLKEHIPIYPTGKNIIFFFHFR